MEVGNHRDDGAAAFLQVFGGRLEGEVWDGSGERLRFSLESEELWRTCW